MVVDICRGGAAARRSKLKLAFARMEVCQACKEKRLGLMDSERRLRKALRCAEVWGNADLIEEAAKALALLLLQSGRKEAEAFIRKYFPHVTFRFSDEVLHAQCRTSRVMSQNVPFVVYDKALSGLAGLRRAFLSPVFWHAHNYIPTKPVATFFSYCHDLRSHYHQEKAVTLKTAHAILQLLRPDFPELAKAKFVEWWCHRRPRCGAHQLHFDSDDEGRNTLRHPIVTAILYFDAVGGPTLVTTQKPSDTTLHRRGAHLVFPRRHRILAFPGNLLHAVLPLNTNNLIEDDAYTSGSRQRRTTLMLAFWPRLTRLRPFSEAPASAVRFPPLSITSSSDQSSNKKKSAAWIRDFYNDNQGLPLLAPYVRSSAFRLSSRYRHLPGIKSCQSPLWVPLHSYSESPPLSSQFFLQDNEEEKKNALIPLPPYEACFQGF